MACIVCWYFKKHSIPSNNGQREAMHVIQRFGGWHIRIANHSNCKTWLQFGRTQGSITKENIAAALMGTKYSFGPTHVWYEVAIGRNVTYIVCSFPLTITRV